MGCSAFIAVFWSVINMTKIKKAHLYVEKYNFSNKELLLDFMDEREFLYFKCGGDYTDNMHLSANNYEPTMLLIYNCAPKKALYPGMTLTLNMETLLKIRGILGLYPTEDIYELPATVLFEIQSGQYFASLIDNPNDCCVSMELYDEYKVYLESSWVGNPCALHYLDKGFELSVWDVGQGNTNCISDKTSLTIFDFGSSIYYSRHKQEDILETHKKFINGHKQISLIISHWDVDHYNLLCSASNDFLKKICCVFYPSYGVGMTMKQVAKRLECNCEFRVSISPLKKMSRYCGIKKVFCGERYALFTGEEDSSKNKSGLLLSVFNNLNVVFLTADHTNYQVWNRMYESVKIGDKKLHIVVPHHGGNCGKTPVRSCLNPGFAIFSVGSNNYGHPNKKTINDYKKAGYKVVRTDRIGYDIVIGFK